MSLSESLIWALNGQAALDICIPTVLHEQAREVFLLMVYNKHESRKVINLGVEDSYHIPMFSGGKDYDVWLYNSRG